MSGCSRHGVQHRPGGTADPAGDRLGGAARKRLSDRAELVEAYLEPLAAAPEMAAVVETGVRVHAIGRHGIDKVVSKGRETRPFMLAATDRQGRARRDLARAVIDASGRGRARTPPGPTGFPSRGSRLGGSDHLPHPGCPGRERGDYAGKTTLVVGGGHSAANVLLDLARLAEDAEGTVILWATRGSELTRLYGGGANDKLAARGALGSNLRALVEGGRVRPTKGFAVTGVKPEGERLLVEGETSCGPRVLGPVDNLVAATASGPISLSPRPPPRPRSLA